MNDCKRLRSSTWTFTGTFAIVLRETSAKKAIADILARRGFSVHSIRHEHDIVCCAKTTIKGVVHDPSRKNGIEIEGGFYASYELIDLIVTADGKTLWSNKEKAA